MLRKGERRRGISQEFGTNIYTLLTVYKTDNQQRPTVQHRELNSVFCNSYKGKESEKAMNKYICVLNHFAEHQKLAQHCKSIILQFLKIVKKDFLRKPLPPADLESGSVMESWNKLCLFIKKTCLSSSIDVPLGLG